MASSSVSEVSETAVYSPFDPDGGGEAGAATAVATGNAGMYELFLVSQIRGLYYPHARHPTR